MKQRKVTFTSCGKVTTVSNKSKPKKLITL